MNPYMLYLTLGVMCLAGAQMAIFQGDKPDFRTIHTTILFGALLLAVGILLHQWIGIMSVIAFTVELFK